VSRSSPTPRKIASIVLERAGTDIRVAFGLASVVALVAIVAIRTDAFLNNEGIFGYLFAGMVGDDPVATLFFLKSRPPLAAFYALPAALGFDAYAIVHALVAAAAVPLTAVVARSAGQRWPNLPAALVAGSAMLVPCAASGVGNSDGMTLGILAAALLFAWRRPALAGAVCALLPLARAETALLVLALVAHVLVRGGSERWRFLLGLAVPAVVYAAAGAVYHEDALWFVHHPPHVTHRNPQSAIMGRQMFGGEPHMITLNFLLLTPAVGLLVFLRPSRLASMERTFGAFLIVFLGLLSILPAVHPLNFGDMPRYVVPALPFLALLGGRAVESLADGADAATRGRSLGVLALAGMLVVGDLQEARHDAPALLVAVAGWSLIAFVAGTRARSAVPAIVVALSFAAAPLLVRDSRLALREEIPALGRYLIEHQGERPLVLTNVSELPLWLARNGGRQVDIRHMMAADQRYEVETLANEAVGQDEALRALLRRHWYGPIVFEEEIPRLLRSGTWLALWEDARTSHILDFASLRGRSETVELAEMAWIVRVTAP
jgi:hypothetical protein